MNWDKKGENLSPVTMLKRNCYPYHNFSLQYSLSIFFFFFLTFLEISGTKEVTASHTEIMKRNRKL